MTVLSFAHLNLRASRPDLDALRDFYCEVVGLTLGPRPAFRSFGYWLYAGGQDVLHLSEAGPDEHPASSAGTHFNHVSFRATERAATEARLRAHGVAFRAAEVPGTGQGQLFFSDPCGNGVELIFDPVASPSLNPSERPAHAPG
ncbi:VOC family protein [Inhella gelatinilytica]|uniref:VOC family protein n=1 Tax=Inhella gelatinilytica TaxID=2795030 RepID=A0A931ISI7_9BURK|nr:VOC family protein [Inhella gelatinilytica]MBH9551890.1 VOC family protein [Inhella gelatinilytica]